MATKKTLEISGMTVDPHIQARETMVSQVVTEYAEAMQAGDLFPQVDVYHDGETDWLADGFHRVEAAKRCGKATIDAVIHEGNRRDATLHSVGSNANHGLRRSNEDKRKAVMTLLEDEEWSQSTAERSHTVRFGQYESISNLCSSQNG
ncbi:ParB N-terminal domain-containing protein [Candidatus Poribacteria bacterium]|nr:ParB N-terminal domain-containing protein [Candidatus Poribacteria bacterium]